MPPLLPLSTGEKPVKLPLLISLAALTLPATAMVAVAAAPVDVMKARHHNFENMGRAMKGLFDQLRKGAPNFKVIQASANTLAASAPRVGSDFPKGSGPESGRKTDALPAIWERQAEFAKAAGQLVVTTKALQAAAASGDLARIKAAAGQAGSTCKGCHDQFRKPQ